MARPKKFKGDRLWVVRMRCTHEFHRRIHACAKREGKTVTALIEDLVNQHCGQELEACPPGFSV